MEHPLVNLLGSGRDGVAVYGSGGLTIYTDQQLAARLGGWAEQGLTRVKMEIGTYPADDLRRVEVTHKAIGDQPNCSWTPTAVTP